ncbi:hypothetical protein ACHAXT_005507 [Thalassiosira profunda]
MIHRLATARSARSLARCGGRAAAASSRATLRPRLPISSAININTSQPIPSARHLSSHDDFSPQKKHDLSEDTPDSTILDLIDSHVKANRIMLYMKGSPSQPQCGFSATVVGILKGSGADFASVNVLEYPEVREGVKKYAQWPTIPQLYVDGEFVGGCDIVKDLDESGELQELLQGPEKKEE